MTEPKRENERPSCESCGAPIEEGAGHYKTPSGVFCLNCWSPQREAEHQEASTRTRKSMNSNARRQAPVQHGKKEFDPKAVIPLDDKELAQF